VMVALSLVMGAALPLLLLPAASAGAGRTIEETESWRTAVFWGIFLILSVVIENVFHHLEHYLEHKKKKGCAGPSVPRRRGESRSNTWTSLPQDSWGGQQN
jgi:hypothetical protein